MTPDDLEDFAQAIADLNNIGVDLARRCAALIGDTPEFNPDGLVEVTDEAGELLATLILPGDDNDDGMENLFLRHADLAETVARGFLNIPSALPCEVRQEARIALANAARRYDPERGQPFAPYARAAINNRLRDLYRRNSTYASHVGASLDEPIGDDSEGTRLDTVADDEDSGPLKRTTLAEARRVLMEIVEESLDERQKQIVLGWLAGIDGPTLGADLGITRQAIHKIKDEAFRRLRWGLRSRGIDASNQLLARGHREVAPADHLAERLTEENFADFLNTLLPERE